MDIFLKVAKRLNMNGYANDTVLLAESAKELHGLLEVLVMESERKGLFFSIVKI